jgi:hypothetical protein
MQWQGRTRTKGWTARHDTEESYEEFVRGDLARLDRKCKKRTSNKGWKCPSDEHSHLAKIKDWRMHVAHKAERC